MAEEEAAVGAVAAAGLVASEAPVAVAPRTTTAMAPAQAM